MKRAITTYRAIILYGIAFLSVSLVTLPEIMFRSILGTISGLLFLSAIAFNAWLGGFWVGLVSSVMSGVASECAVFLPNDDSLIGDTLPAIVVLAAGVFISWACTQGRYYVPSIAPAESKIIRLMDHVRVKRADNADGGEGAPQRGPLVVVQDLRQHLGIARLAASEMDGGAESTLGMTQLRSYLNWALEQIESDVTALDTSISASNEQTAPDSDSNIRKMPTAE